MKPIKDCLDYLVKIHDMWSQLSKIPTSRRSTENTVKNQAIPRLFECSLRFFAISGIKKTSS